MLYFHAKRGSRGQPNLRLPPPQLQLPMETDHPFKNLKIPPFLPESPFNHLLGSNHVLTREQMEPARAVITSAQKSKAWIETLQQKLAHEHIRVDTFISDHKSLLARSALRCLPLEILSEIFHYLCSEPLHIPWVETRLHFPPFNLVLVCKQ